LLAYQIPEDNVIHAVVLLATLNDILFRLHVDEATFLLNFTAAKKVDSIMVV